MYGHTYVAVGLLATLKHINVVFPCPSGVDPLGPHLTKKKTDIAAIASVLKQYFRDLAEPLFPVEKYHEFVESAREFVDLLWFTVQCCVTK